MVVLEVNTRRALTSEERRADLAESLAFTRRHLAAAKAVASGVMPSGVMPPGVMRPGGAHPGATRPGSG